MTFLDWWSLYPRKVCKLDAEKAYKAASKKYPPGQIHSALRAYLSLIQREKTERQFIPYPATWIRSGRFLDDDLQHQEQVATQDQIEAAQDYADRYFKRGKYAEKYG